VRTYIAIFVIAAFSSLVLTPLLRRFCERYRLLDEPVDDRRLHVRPMPRLGGIAIFIAVILALSGLMLLDNMLTQALAPVRGKFFTMLVPATLVLLLGVYDDLRGANAVVKFIGLALAGALLYALGGRIDELSVPYLGLITLKPVFAFALTVFWTVAISNAFNLIDGVDGLATGAGLFASLVIFVVSLLFGQPLVTVVALALTGALVGFLRYNFNPASIFLGDSGSLFVGFTLAALSITGSEKSRTAVAVAIPVLAFGLPVVDTSITMVRRLISGKPIFKGDREHVHHMLLARGWSQRQVTLILYGVCAFFGVLALLIVSKVEHVTGLILFVVSAALVMGVGHLRYHEVDEIKASMKRNLGDRRVRAANNIGVRRACRALSTASTLGDLFDGVLEMLEFGEFSYATVQLSCDDRAEINEQALARSARSNSLRDAELQGGRIQWRWQSGTAGAEEVIGSGRFWTIRLPLSTNRKVLGYINLYRAFDSADLQMDINYLCSFFQRELSSAAERVFDGCKDQDLSAQLGLPMTAGKTSG
jgi:UDP-GlcNAc:undecaprenyl-phosphate GlcNAc-1-phosphate transferase